MLLELGSDRITAELTKAVLQGTFFTNVEIEGYAEDATGLRLVDEYRFSSVEFTDQQTSGGAGTNVELTLDYGRFEQGHVDAAGAVTSFLWDGAPTVMDSLTPVQADADPGQGGTTAGLTDLRYFVRINGGALRTDTGGEWLELSGFSLGYELKRDIGEIREQPPT